MKTKRGLILGGSLVATVLAVGVLGDVRAQNQPGVNVDVTVRSDETLTGPQQLEWVKSKTQNARMIADRVQRMLDQARDEKDTLKIDCLDDKLTQIRVNLKGVETRTQSLQLSVQAADTTTSNQQFTILKIQVSKIEGLRAEAENCVGDIDVLLGQTQTTVTVDDDITTTDPADDPLDFILVNPDPYPPASGFQ